MKLTLLLRPPQKGHCEDELSSVLVFFSYSDLGSARSQQGQGLPSVTQLKTCHYFVLCSPGIPSSQSFTPPGPPFSLPFGLGERNGCPGGRASCWEDPRSRRVREFTH